MAAPTNNWRRKDVDAVVDAATRHADAAEEVRDQVETLSSSPDGPLERSAAAAEATVGAIGAIEDRIKDVVGDPGGPWERSAVALEALEGQSRGAKPFVRGLRRGVDAAQEIARSSRAQVSIALDGDSGRGSIESGNAAGAAPEQVVRALTRWQGNDPSSLVRALRASFEQTTVQGRSLVRYRGAGRVVATPHAATTGPNARNLRRIGPGLEGIRDLLDRLQPVDPTADAVAARSSAAAIRDRLDTYAEELGRGYDARPARLRALLNALRGDVAGVIGGALARLEVDLGIAAAPATAEEEALSDDYLVLVEYVYALDGTGAPVPAPAPLGPSEWRDDVVERSGALSDVLRELRMRLRVEGISEGRMESRVFAVSGERQSVSDVLGWIEDLADSTVPRLVDSLARVDAQEAIEAELVELRPWVARLQTLDMFAAPLLEDGVVEVLGGIRRLRKSLRRV